MLNELLSQAYKLLEIQSKIERNKICDEIIIADHKLEIQQFKENHPNILKEKFARIH